MADVPNAPAAGPTRGGRGTRGARRGRGRGRGGAANAAEVRGEAADAQREAEHQPPPPPVDENPFLDPQHEGGPPPAPRMRSPSPESPLHLQCLLDIASPSTEVPRAGPHSRQHGRRSRSPTPTQQRNATHANDQSAPRPDAWNADPTPQDAQPNSDKNHRHATKDVHTFYEVKGDRRNCLFCTCVINLVLNLLLRS